MTALSFLTGRRGVLQEVCSPQPFGNETPLLSPGREMKGLSSQWLGSCRSQATDVSRAVILSTLPAATVPPVYYTCFSVYTGFSSLLGFLGPLCPLCVSLFCYKFLLPWKSVLDITASDGTCRHLFANCVWVLVLGSQLDGRHFCVSALFWWLPYCLYLTGSGAGE